MNDAHTTSFAGSEGGQSVPLVTLRAFRFVCA